MAKIMKCAGNDDSVTLRANEDGDMITFVFDSPSKSLAFPFIPDQIPSFFFRSRTSKPVRNQAYGFGC